MPLPERFLAGIEPDDQFVLAYPRSGSRWVRILMTDMFGQSQGLDLSAYYDRVRAHESVQEDRESNPPEVVIIANAHGHSRDRCSLPSWGLTPIFRSHHLVEVWERSKGHVVYVLRDPGPTFFSYFQFARMGGHLSEEVTLEQFSEYQLPQWIDHVTTMLEFHKASPGRVLFLVYQDQGPFLKSQLEACAAHLGLPVLEGAAERAILRLKDFLAHLNSQPGIAPGRGENEKVKAQIPAELQARIMTATREVFEAAQAVAIIGA